MAYTNGFAATEQMNSHFLKHGADFGATSVKEYTDFADKFLGDVKPPHVHECRRRGGDTVRFDPIKDYFGIIGDNGTIRTFYRPVPCSSLPAGQRHAARLARRCHTDSDNLGYFRKECRK
jgi:pyocin large subunit-like protein